MNIAFANLASSGWTAGGQYLLNLFTALKSPGLILKPEITLLAVRGTPPDAYRLLDPLIDKVVFIQETRWQRYWKSIYLRIPIPGWLEGLVLPRRVLASQLSLQHVDILFSNDEYGPNFPTPLITWIPDFQHIHLPELFSSSKIKTRNRHNLRIARFASRIMLSSQSALRDLEQTSPEAVKKARVVSFVAQIPGNVYDLDPEGICESYHLPSKFFFLPNQFWVHKNHTVVIEALTRLKVTRPEIVVVCTGNPYEFRGKDYYSQLLSTIHERGLEDKMLFLGIVPREHIFKFMRQSLALLQPSLFEGWSTTIEEAKSLGKSVIASDIPVHKEQAPPDSTFFNPLDPHQLADILVEVYDRKGPGSDVKLEANARQLLPVRTRKFAENFLEVVGEVVAGK